MINFYDGQITDLLPAVYSDDANVQAISLALRAGTRMICDYAQRVYIYCSIETAPEEVVDYLAKELRTQYYSDAFDLETKRALVRNTMFWYMYAGTPAAVEELVTLVFGEASVMEWYEYGGEPYWFLITTDVTLTEETMTYFSEMIKRVKNTRSHLWTISVPREIEMTFYAGAEGLSFYHPAAIMDGYDVLESTEVTEYAGVGGIGYYKSPAVRELNLN